jgi:heat shock protein HtpX
MPKEVYLIAEVNAWVAQRGGILGVGSRRVVGLGLPLMRILSVAQLRAVLAHEFGHYYGGDTRLGPLVYSMRSAIGRTFYNLAPPLPRLFMSTAGRCGRIPESLSLFSEDEHAFCFAPQAQVRRTIWEGLGTSVPRNGDHGLDLGATNSSVN